MASKDPTKYTTNAYLIQGIREDCQTNKMEQNVTTRATATHEQKSAAMRILQAEKTTQRKSRFSVENNRITTAKLDETKRRKRAMVSMEEVLADKKIKAEARSNQQLKKSMAILELMIGRGKQESQWKQCQIFNTIYHYLGIAQGRIMESCFILPL